MSLAGCVWGMLLPYMCFTIGHLFKKHQVAASIGFYLLSFIIIQILTSIISFPTAMKTAVYPEGITMLIAPLASAFRLYGIYLIISIIMSIISFLITKYIMGKKLNLN